MAIDRLKCDSTCVFCDYNLAIFKFFAVLELWLIQH